MTKAKRSTAPAHVPIARKRFKWTITHVGPHPKKRSIQLGILLRDVLGYARNMREIRHILNEGYVKVDGRVIKQHGFSIGLMDVIEITPIGKFYRILPTHRTLLHPVEIEASEKHLKLCQVIKKNLVKGGVIQLALHDGRALIVKGESTISAKPGGTILLDLVEGEPVDYAPFEPGVTALIVGGRRRGVLGFIHEVERVRKLGQKMVSMRLPSGTVAETVKGYVFPVGKKEPFVSIPIIEEVLEDEHEAR